MTAASKIVQFLVEDEGSWNFTTPLTDRSQVTVYGLPPQQSTSGGSATVHWRVNIDARGWGISDITPSIDRIAILAVVEEEPEDPNADMIESELRIDYNAAQEHPAQRPAEHDHKGMIDFYNSFTAKVAWNRQESFDERTTSIMPTSLEVDLAQREITVYFG